MRIIQIQFIYTTTLENILFFHDFHGNFSLRIIFYKITLAEA